MTREPFPTEAVDPMVSGKPEVAEADRRECLVIILGQTRASGATSESFDRFLVAPLAQGGRVDIALCRCSGYGEDDGYYASRASYVWEIPEPESWNPLFDEVAGEAAANAGVARPADWRTLIDIRGNWLGEIDEAEGKRPGSAARCLYLRRHALGMIRSLGLEIRYRWFILTRSDYLYLFDHPPLRLLDSRHTWLPRGQDSQGITDRHAVFSAASLRQVLGVLDELLLAPSEYRRSMTRYGDWNFEKFLKLAFIRNGLYRSTRRFPRVMYLVRQAETDTSWSKGFLDAKTRLFVKYPTEKSRAEADAAVLRKGGGWRPASLRPTIEEVADRAFVGRSPLFYSGLLYSRSRLEGCSPRLAASAAILGVCGVALSLATVCGERNALVAEPHRDSWDVAVQMLLVHAAVVLCISTAMYSATSGLFCRRLAQAGLVLLVGTALCSAGLIGGAVTEYSVFTAAGIVGAAILVVGWMFLAVIARRMWTRY
jgi:uncharacterized membrane protein YgdD (TMEM256/DUF423 family)